jgi:hypothetical protein
MLPARSSGPRYAVGLYRVSTSEQGHSGLGLEARQASVRAFAAAQGWAVVAEYSDIASGKVDRWTSFQAALARCRQLGAVLVAVPAMKLTGHDSAVQTARTASKSGRPGAHQHLRPGRLGR